MRLFEYIYAFFDIMDSSFIEGKFTLFINRKPYELMSRDVVILDKHDFEVFDELIPYYEYLSKKSIDNVDSVPSTKSTIVTLKYFKNHLARYKGLDDKAKAKIKILSKRSHCIEVKIGHDLDGDPFAYFNTVRDRNGLEIGKNIFLNLVRQFNDYHILSKAPYVYLTDIHFRTTDGMFCYIGSESTRRISNVQPVLSFWTPKFEIKAKDKAQDYFKKDTFPIEDMLMAKALVYAEQQHLSFAIIHSVMTLEVVVPKLIDTYLTSKGVTRSTVQDFNKKFGLSVRVKAFLKLILPKSNHHIIDTVGQAVKIRNDILHKGLQDPALTVENVKSLVDSCQSLKIIVEKYLHRYTQMNGPK